MSLCCVCVMMMMMMTCSTSPFPSLLPYTTPQSLDSSTDAKLAETGGFQYPIYVPPEVKTAAKFVSRINPIKTVSKEGQETMRERP